jgi:MFS family permease
LTVVGAVVGGIVGGIGGSVAVDRLTDRFGWARWSVYIITAGYVLFIVRAAPMLWTGRFRDARLDPPPTYWPWGGMLWRAWVRAWFIAGVGSGSLVLLLPAIVLDSVPDWYVYVSLAAFVLAAIVAMSVVLFNRPRFVIPPHLRDEPGLVAEMIAAARRRLG